MSSRGWSCSWEDDNRPKLIPMPLEQVKVCCAMKAVAMSEDVASADRRAALNTLLSAKGDTGNLSLIPDSDLTELARLVCPEPDEWTRNLVGTLCGYNVDGLSLAGAQAYIALTRKRNDTE